MSNEVFILQLRNMIDALEGIRQTVSAEIQKLDEIAKRLGDESHLGTSAAFDFGKEDQAKAVEQVKKKISKSLREIKKLSKDLEASQNKKIAERSGTMTDAIDKQ